jgi:5'-phosphate synthase pdxT subunit
VNARDESPRIGVLALQGDFEAHRNACRRARMGEAAEVRTVRDLEDVDALILPGGESTTISKGLARTGLHDAIRARIAAGMPVLGTCAGAILLSQRVKNGDVPTLEALEATAVRNAYGTQVDSFATTVDRGAGAGLDGLHAVFIRAPRLEALGRDVQVLARVDGAPVLVRQGNVLAATFHPELTDDPRVHRLLLDCAAAAAKPRAGARA